MEYLKSPFFTFYKGRVALFAILRAMGIKDGDEVILPGFTCVVVPSAVRYVGAKPVYVDIDPASFNIDPDKIEDRITKRTRAIIAQHTFGMPADMDRISGIARNHSLYLIEDACHALGATYKGRSAGEFGDAAFFSSQWSKPVTTGLGGWAVVHNERVLRNMESLYPEFAAPSLGESWLMRLQYLAHSLLYRPSTFWLLQGMYRKLSAMGLAIGSSGAEELQGQMPEDYRKVMSPWQRSLLYKKLSQCDSSIRHRRWISAFYAGALKERNMRREIPHEEEAVFLRYPLLVHDKKRMLEEAKKTRIELGDWFLSPVHPNQNGWEKAGYKKGTCPEAEKVCSHIVNLPTHQGVSLQTAEKIVAFVAGRRPAVSA